MVRKNSGWMFFLGNVGNVASEGELSVFLIGATRKQLSLLNLQADHLSVCLFGAVL